MRIITLGEISVQEGRGSLLIIWGHGPCWARGSKDPLCPWEAEADCFQAQRSLEDF